MVTLKTFCVSHEQDNKPTKDKVAKPNVDFANLKMYVSSELMVIKGDKNYNTEEVLMPTITLKAQQNNSYIYPKNFTKEMYKILFAYLILYSVRQGWQTTILI